MVKILKKQRIDVVSYRIEAHGDRDAELPHPYTRIVLTHIFTGPSLRRDSIEHVVALVDEKYCSISATLPRGLVENRVYLDDSTRERP